MPFSTRNNGTCYRQCQGRSILLSPNSSSAMPLSSSLGWRSGTEGKGGLSHCLWVLSVTENLKPCSSGELCPPVALTLHPDSHTYCKVSYKISSHDTYKLVLKLQCGINIVSILSSMYFQFIIHCFCRVHMSMCLMAFLVLWTVELYMPITIFLEHFVAPQDLCLLLLRPHQVCFKFKKFKDVFHT